MTTQQIFDDLFDNNKPPQQHSGLKHVKSCRGINKKGVRCLGPATNNGFCRHHGGLTQRTLSENTPTLLEHLKVLEQEAKSLDFSHQKLIQILQKPFEERTAEELSILPHLPHAHPDTYKNILLSRIRCECNISKAIAYRIAFSAEKTRDNKTALKAALLTAKIDDAMFKNLERLGVLDHIKLKKRANKLKERFKRKERELFDFPKLLLEDIKSNILRKMPELTKEQKAAISLNFKQGHQAIQRKRKEPAS